MKPYFVLLSLLIISCCSEPIYRPVKKIVIGFSQCTMVDTWRQAMVDEMKREIGFFRDYEIELIVKDANDDNNKQIKDIQELVNSKIDILIVSPNEADQLTPIVEEVYNKGIPVIVIDRKINSSSYTAYVGADNLLIGREAGYFAAELLKGNGKILEITGLQGSTPAIERSKGFHEIINKYPQISTVKTIEGAWLEDKTLHITDSLFRTFTDFNLIFAHNDFMANAASKSALKYNLKPYIIGIDGMNISMGGVEMIINGLIDGTIFYPTGGDKAIQLAIDILAGNQYERTNIQSTFRIDNSNARTIWLQGQQMKVQQDKIDMQSDRLDSLTSVLSKRNILLVLTYIIIILLIVVVFIIFYNLRNKNKMNALLDEKNKTINQQNKIITKQRDDSYNLLIAAEEAKENKLRLFTDLSHEFRTIVTLITNPVKDLLDTAQDEATKRKLRVLQRSSERLARLTDGILKFRNIDENKYNLIYVHANLSKFLENVIEIFQEQANKKDIKLISEIAKEIYCEFDVGVIEKVLYNLLSNAIKFTPRAGSVSISLKSIDSKIIIVVKDSGCGIPKKDLPFIFDRFYKSNSHGKISGNDKIGIGLALCKELLQLHGGLINVTSIEHKGSTFTVTVPQFHQISQQDTLDSLTIPQFHQISQQDTLDSLANSGGLYFENNIKPDFKKTILIVEDNPDVLIVLANIISKHYKVITASNGRDGLNLTLKKLPNLVVNDILMPVMDGMQLCIEIKKNLSTCHIPVVLLTAVDSQENVIKGFDIGADAYITKPFNEFLLLSNIRNLIDSREKLKSFFCPSPFFRKLLESKNTEKEEFLKDCLNNIYENLQNEDYTMTTLSEKMNMSRSSLYRKIKEISSIKPVDFIKKAKLNYAARLLVKGNGYTINEISWRSGFNDPKYFSKCFMQEYGVNPSQYAKDFQMRFQGTI